MQNEGECVDRCTGEGISAAAHFEAYLRTVEGSMTRLGVRQPTRGGTGKQEQRRTGKPEW